MTNNHKKDVRHKPKIDTGSYRGPDRRSGHADERISSFVRFDEKGNPVWEVRSNVPRRRHNDETLNLVKCLDNDILALEDDVEAKKDPHAFNPYGTADD